MIKEILDNEKKFKNDEVIKSFHILKYTAVLDEMYANQNFIKKYQDVLVKDLGTQVYQKLYELSKQYVYACIEDLQELQYPNIVGKKVDYSQERIDMLYESGMTQKEVDDIIESKGHQLHKEN